MGEDQKQENRKEEYEKNIIVILCLVLSIGTSSIVLAAKTGDQNYSSSVVDFELSNDNITLQHNGMSEFIEIKGIHKNGKIKDFKKEVEFKTANQEVAIAIEGRILAIGEGSTEIYVTYGDIEKVIYVEVLQYQDLEVMMKEMSLRKRSLTTAEREAIVNKASAMYNVSWTPTQQMTGYKGYYTYYTNQTYNIPYSQTEYQKDDVGFEAVTDDNDFYDYYTRYGYVMPKYGNDCSAFVSFAWGVSRETSSSFIAKIQDDTYPKVGAYVDFMYPNNITTPDLLNSYPSMQSGDAVVRNGHVILIGDNYSTFAFCYEQVGPDIELTYWTYADLADELYMPFSRE